ncbi:DUF4060 family protein [Klebsiella aerogenes]|nr:DUF4060 family protein [Klebsiella aerogenes]
MQIALPAGVVTSPQFANFDLVNRRCSYVATAMSCARRLQHLPGQCN